MGRAIRTGLPSTPPSTTCSAGSASTPSPRPRRKKTASGCKRAAAREFQIIQTLDHPGILPVLDYKEHENGPALLFRYLDPNAVRFDHYLATNGHKLTTDQRLDLLRQIADAIRYAHRKRVIHRALSPQSILVTDAASSTPRLQIYNWQVGVREASLHIGPGHERRGSGRGPSRSSTCRPKPCPIPARSPRRRMSSRWGPSPSTCSPSRPPASSPTDLAKILREQKGLSISSVLDGAGPKLEELIQWSTHPDVLTRIGSVEDFLTLLDDVEDELTAPAETVVVDPLQAKRGDRLRTRLRRGAGPRAGSDGDRPARHEGRQGVRPQGGARARTTTPGSTRRPRPCGSIHSEFIVAIEDELIMNGRTVLVLQKAGDKTLAAHAANGGRAEPGDARPLRRRPACRRSARWSGMASPIGTSSPTTSASAR